MKWLEMAYEVHLDLAEGIAAVSGRRRGSLQRENIQVAQQRQALLAKLGGILLRAYEAAVVVPAAAAAVGNRVEGGEAAEILPTSMSASTLEIALEYGHERWSEKQGRSKVARGPVGTAASPKGKKRTLPCATPVVGPSSGSDSQQQQQQSPGRRNGEGRGEDGGGGRGGNSPKRRCVLHGSEDEEQKETRIDKVLQGHPSAPSSLPPSPPSNPSPTSRAEIIEVIDDGDDEILV